jgi:hypothetical protein
VAGEGPLPQLPSSILKAPVEESDLAGKLRAEHQEQADALQREIDRRDEDIAYYQNRLMLMEANNGQLDTLARSLHCELQSVYGSRSWRVTLPLRWSMAKLRSLSALRKKLFAKKLPPPVWPPDVRALETRVDLQTVASPPADAAIGVFLHMYYVELAVEMFACLRNLPDSAAVFISTDSEDKEKLLWSVFRREGLLNKVEIRVFPNRGWDIAPFLVGFADRIPDFPLILRLHSKRSTFISCGVGDIWRRMMYGCLAGSPLRVNAILQAFADDPSLGMAAPPTLDYYANCITIGGNYALMRGLLDPFHIDLAPDTPIDFPAGSMFWCRSEVLTPWLELSFEDFPFTPDSERDGTLAHALERLLFFGCGITNHTWTRLPALEPQFVRQP